MMFKRNLLEKKSNFAFQNAKNKALLLSSIMTIVVALGLLFTPQKYEASVLISYDPSEVKNEWDLLIDETRNVDFEEQIRSRAVLAPVMEEIYHVSEFGLDSARGSTETFLKKLPLNQLFLTQDRSPDQLMEYFINQFQRNLKVERIHHSSLLRITVQLTSAEMSSTAANAIELSFLNFRRQLFYKRVQERLTAIEMEIVKTQEELSNSLDKRNSFLKEKGWDDYNGELKAATDRVFTLKQIWIKFDTYDITRIASQPEDGAINQMNQKMNEINSRYFLVKSRFKEGSPPVIQITQEKEMFERTVAEYIKDRKKEISVQLKSAQNTLQQLLKAESTVQAIQGAIIQAKKRYETLLDQRSATRIQMDTTTKDSENFGNLRLLDRAVIPPTISLLKRYIKIGLSSGAAFLISFCLLLIIFEVWSQTLLFLFQQQRENINPLGRKHDSPQSSKFAGLSV